MAEHQAQEMMKQSSEDLTQSTYKKVEYLENLEKHLSLHRLKHTKESRAKFELYRMKMMTLMNMGFTDFDLNLNLVKLHNGDIEKVIADILSQL